MTPPTTPTEAWSAAIARHAVPPMPVDAVAAMAQHDVGLAVLDVLMPGISGDAVAERLRQVDPTLPVLLMTGADGDFASGSGLPILRKPFPQEELVADVRRLVPR